MLKNLKNKCNYHLFWRKIVAQPTPCRICFLLVGRFSNTVKFKKSILYLHSEVVKGFLSPQAFTISFTVPSVACAWTDHIEKQYFLRLLKVLSGASVIATHTFNLSLNFTVPERWQSMCDLTLSFSYLSWFYLSTDGSRWRCSTTKQGHYICAARLVHRGSKGSLVSK